MRRAQLTVFVIVGLVIMLSAAIILYYASKRIPIEEVLLVPTEAKPVHDFVTNCIDIVAKEAVERLGTQGGYINLPGIIAKTPSSYIPVDSSAVFKTPLWYYEGEDRTPSIQDIEQDISAYVTAQLRTCTKGFTSHQQFSVAEQANITTATTLTEEDVRIKVIWPLLLTKGQTTTSIKDFAVKEQVKLKKIWKTAKAIMNSENKGTFFENLTIDWMSGNPNIPMDGFEFSCKPRRWKLPEIKTELQTSLSTNLPYIRLENTNYPPFNEKRSSYNDISKARERMLKNLEADQTIEQQKLPQAPEDAYEFFKMTMDAGAPPSELVASFTYQPEWELSMSAQPNNGQTLISNNARGGGVLRLFCINQWHFTYDVIYPVKATLRDNSAFANTGYQFSFGFPVLIDDNAENRINFGLQKFQAVPVTTEFCEELGDQLVDIRAIGAITGSIISSELKDANITYKCFTQTCELGTTTADEGAYRLRTYLPRGCKNPFITASKNGYLPQTKALEGTRLAIELPKLTKVNTSIAVHPYYLPEDKFISQQSQLSPGQEALLHITHKNTSFEQTLTLPSNQTTLELLAGEYELEVILAVRGKQVGGYKNEKLKISADELSGAQNMAVHAVEFRPHPRTDEEQYKMTTFIFANQKYKEELRPELQ
ncbi:MAG: hypothetical protein HY363_01845 [Candidatus Aenigmarchaeota archaeon]|nr:hypothetical protein [Candidatus Aenigmarchaeota archaeon]